MPHVTLAIDQGTTSSRAIVFDDAAHPARVGAEELTQHLPGPGPGRARRGGHLAPTLSTARAALAKAGRALRGVAAIGITNQRETTIVWDRAHRQRPIHRAIVWQDRRTAELARRLQGSRATSRWSAQRTGPAARSVFLGTKIAWLLDNVDGARAAAEQGELAFGTVDSFLLWRLTGGSVHATDATNASRTLLFDISTRRLGRRAAASSSACRARCCRRCATPPATSARPSRRCSARPIPIRGVAGDQQAATVGQACFAPGMMKSTYGTGCFALLNTGEQAGRLEQPAADDGRLPARRQAHLCARRRDLHRRRRRAMAARRAEADRRPRRDVDALAAAADPAEQVYLVPAFAGLGAPWWDPKRAAPSSA